MYGAIVGDIIGSIYEHRNIKSKTFPLFSLDCVFTDDTVMTVAVASALLRNRKNGTPLEEELIRELRYFGRRFPNAGYGGTFRKWLRTAWPKPYNSWGNGAAMRVSPCGLIATSLEEAWELARQSAEVTHNHPEGVKGARAIATAIYLAKTGSTKEEIRDFVRENFYLLDQTLDEIRPEYTFDVSCQGSVPQAIQAFLESKNYEDCIRNAISIGGDSDTIAAMAGSIAWTYYGRNGLTSDMEEMKSCIQLPDMLQRVVDEFDKYLKETRD